MIAHLTGILSSISADYVIVDVNGVGYQVHLSQICMKALPWAGQKIELHIYTHVREDQLSLFGFASREEKTIFLRLLNVSGIGPKLAMTILSGMTPSNIVDAVVKEDLARLNAIQGVGKKTAERIIVDLKDKFLKEFAGGIGVQQTVSKPLYNDALSALTNLGYQRTAVEKLMSKIDFARHTTLQSVVKEALKGLKVGEQ